MPSSPSASHQDENAFLGAERVRPSAALRAARRERTAEREQMVKEQVMARGIDDARVLAALRQVPRHCFVPSDCAKLAYTDGPLGIPGEQTISQPYIVACMSQAARLQPRARVLEIGTGSGYQTAVLAELCDEIYSVEFLPEVAAFGRRHLEALGYLEHGVELRVGDGYEGWPEQSPFDAILVTAAPARVPPPLLRQLAIAGRLVIPVGTGADQRLELWTRERPGGAENAFSCATLFGVRFVPFLGSHGE
jgi:protein-L-isoaspartate(D-aspartate) O-methyltransferase